MIHLRRASERGRSEFGWLDSRHTFSFGDYQDRAYMGFRSLRVINDDRVAPGGGFPRHPHRDMEIISYVLEGALAHEDSTGGGSVIRAGDLQRMSAGRGIVHSEFNHSKKEPVHFLQIWIMPRERGIAPGYEQRTIAPAEKRGRLRLVATPGGGDGALDVRQDARLYIAALEAGERVEHSLARGRGAWVHVARGAVTVNGQRLEDGDGAAIEDEARIEIAAAEKGGEALLFDLA
jgi:redox-sensitive bicupin YhaK (pirin superfamily)